MSKQQILDPIDGYLKEINSLLPYPDKRKATVLEELRRDVQDAMGSEKRPPSVVFGSPVVVAKNLSVAQDWGTKPAGWGTRVLAFIIDFMLLIGFIAIFIILRLISTDFQLEEIALYDMHIPFWFMFIGLPLYGLILGYFIFFEGIYSTTFGKRLLGLMVVDESGIKITWIQTLTRNLTKVPFLSTFLPFDILLGILSEKTKGRKQRVLDFVAGTTVVKKV
jgi:uncharacterized RDD family membrane protein YckC